MKKKLGLLFFSLLSAHLFCLNGQAEETDAIMSFAENHDTAGPVMPYNPSIPFTDGEKKSLL